MRKLNATALLIAFVLLHGCTTLVPIPEPQSIQRSDNPLDAYARVLHTYVNESGEVDFPALQKQPGDLYYYIAYVAQFPASSISNPNVRLAHYINSYNALSMYNVLASNIPKTHEGWAKVRFFYLRDFLIGGKEMSLYSYENDVIRKLKDPRVHFALNCSASGCPILPKIPFSAANLYQALDRETRKFFSENRNLRIDHSLKTVYLSELLDFYTDDFISKETPSLIAYVNLYSREKIPKDYVIDFIPYDWNVANSAR
ncbi:DUF547 domain-containing protein [Methyloglobulus sp.]|uniref:DUF547 domain-containing protein n=1 Tax=Methyloglobulus sp. TaxID=2518622 RepID=UPI0032B7A402